MSKFDKVVMISVIIAVLVGVFVSAYLLWPHSSYSALYIYPGYPNYVRPGSIVKFRYGVECHEDQTTNYTLRIYIGDKLIKVERFRLNPNQVLVRNESVYVPKNAKFPLKVSLVLTTMRKSYEVHFWLKSVGQG